MFFTENNVYFNANNVEKKKEKNAILKKQKEKPTFLNNNMFFLLTIKHLTIFLLFIKYLF